MANLLGSDLRFLEGQKKKKRQRECGGGFSPGLLEFAYPAWAGAAECQQPTNAE